MRTARKVPFFIGGLFVVAPLAWGAGGSKDTDFVKRVTVPELSRVASAAGTGTTLCHRSPDNPSITKTIVVGEAAVMAHLAHGDTLGACPQDCSQECPPPQECPPREECQPEECPPDDCPICPEPKSGVARTGQTGCWDATGAPVNCAGTGQDGQYQTGTSATPRFTDNSDGTVTDNLTALIWLKDADCFGATNWSSALNSANALATGVCGLTDGSAAGSWRLPNLKELQSLIDFGTTDPALPAGYPFLDVQYVTYWSSTSHAMAPAFAWFLSFSDGTVSNAGKSNPFLHVWPVRGGQ
jgi:hypothetical protein